MASLVNKGVDADSGRLRDSGRLGDVERRNLRLPPASAKAVTKPADLAAPPESELEQDRTSPVIGRVSPRSSPNDRIADFIAPNIREPAILQGARALGILEYLQNKIPELAESNEFRALATAVITTEIARRRGLLAQLHRGIAT